MAFLHVKGLINLYRSTYAAKLVSKRFFFYFAYYPHPDINSPIYFPCFEIGFFLDAGNLFRSVCTAIARFQTFFFIPVIKAPLLVSPSKASFICCRVPETTLPLRIRENGFP